MGVECECCDCGFEVIVSLVLMVVNVVRGFDDGVFFRDFCLVFVCMIFFGSIICDILFV